GRADKKGISPSTGAASSFGQPIGLIVPSSASSNVGKATQLLAPSAQRTPLSLAYHAAIRRNSRLKALLTQRSAIHPERSCSHGVLSAVPFLAAQAKLPRPLCHA